MSSSESPQPDATTPLDGTDASPAAALPTTEAASQHSDLPDDDAEADANDLFGDVEDENAAASPKRRRLDDSELDSGDDAGREDRAGQEEEEEIADESESKNHMEVELTRNYTLESSDNELYLMKVPRFLTLDPHAWHHTRFEPPTTDHHSKLAPSSAFSPFNTAMTTLRWRYSPTQPDELQSNARILRWSDGSLTLQLASDPTTQYEIDANGLAPPQRSPPKPTPTSVKEHKRAGARGYDAGQDSFTYLAIPHAGAGVMRITNKLTTGLSVLPSADTTDDALERLTSSLAAAASRGRQNSAADAVAAAAAAKVTEDPELARKRAEQAEKEKIRAQRRRETQETRERERATRVLGRSGLRPGAAGLTVGGLEDEDGGAAPMRNRLHGAKQRRPRRGGYDSEEEDFGRRKTREDEYDEEDDFIAPSDEGEEPEEEDDEAEEEEEEAEERSPKRSRPAARETDDAGRSKRRRIVDEDEDEEA